MGRPRAARRQLQPLCSSRGDQSDSRSRILGIRSGRIRASRKSAQRKWECEVRSTRLHNWSIGARPALQALQPRQNEQPASITTETRRTTSSEGSPFPRNAHVSTRSRRSCQTRDGSGDVYECQFIEFGTDEITRSTWRRGLALDVACIISTFGWKSKLVWRCDITE